MTINTIRQKKHWALSVLFLTITSTFAQGNSPIPEISITSQPTAISIVQKNESAIISFAAEKDNSEITYQWYSSADGTTQTGSEIEGAVNSSYTTEPFTDKDIRYYYCVATAGNESIISNVASVAYTGLPILYVNTPEGVEITSKEIWTENASLTLIDAENDSYNFENVSTSIRGRGNTTWKKAKKPYAIKLNNKQSIMGMPKHKRWVLIANYLDNSFLKNHMAFYLSEKMEMDYTVRGKFVDLFFNGTYRGLYWLGEAIKVDENRVNIDDGNKKIKDEEDKDYLIEMDSYFDETVRFKPSISQMPYMIKNDDYMVDDNGEITTGGEARLARLQSKIEKLETLLYPDYIDGMTTNDCEAPNEIYTKIIDVDSWAKFWLINEVMDNLEIRNPKSAYFTYDSKNNILKAGPVWDFDWASLTMKDCIRLRSSLYYNALFKSPLFNEATKRIWEKYVSKIQLEPEIEFMREYLRIAAQVDKIKWGVHLDPSEIELADFDAYVDFFKEVLINKFNVVNNYVTQKMPEIKVVSPTITLSSESFVYNGSKNTPIVTITDNENTLVEGVDYTISFYDNINAGNATVVFAAKGNYAGLLEKTFVINPKPVILTVANTSKYTGENDPTISYTIEGLVSINGGEDELNGISLTRETGESEGKYAISATVDADANPNYIVTTKDGLLTIKSRPIWFVETETSKRVVINGNYSGDLTVNVPEAVEVDEIEFNRDFTPDIPATVILPFTLPKGTTINADFYQITEIKQVGNSWKASAEYIGDGMIPQANTPYAVILHNCGEGCNSLQFNLNGGKAIVQTAEINKIWDTSKNWYFTGTYSYKVWADDDEELGLAYAFAGKTSENGAAKGTFGKVIANETYANPMRAYLMKKDASVQLVAQKKYSADIGESSISNNTSAIPETIDIEFIKGITNDEHNTTTVVRAIKAPNTYKVYRRYDLQGRRLNKTPKTKGVYYVKRAILK